MPFSSRSFTQATVALLIVALAALLAIVGTTIWLGERSQSYFNDVLQARDARTAASDLRNTLRLAESSQRGFLITGDQSYETPYETAKSHAPAMYAALQQSLVPFPGYADNLDQLKKTIDSKFAEMDSTIALKRAGRDADAVAVVHTDLGKSLMEDALAFLGQVTVDADGRLTEDVAQQRANAAWLRWVSIIGAVVIVAVVGGSAVVVVKYTQDLGEARDEVAALNAGLEARVAERTADLAQANDEIQRFAYIVTHDLRAPLVNIMGFTSELETSMASIRALLERDPAEGDAVAAEARQAALVDLPEAIDFIRSSTRKMDGLINAILKLSREGRRVLRPEKVDLGDLLRNAAAAVQHQISEAEGAVELSVNVPSIVTDRLSLEQVVGNLLDNAVKYRAKDRPLRLDVRAHPALENPVRIAIEIADNGRGIAEQDRERVFELFRRSGVQDQPGEGIGLAYVRAVVRNLGGDITLTSALDKGTTFRITLPRSLNIIGSSK